MRIHFSHFFGQWSSSSPASMLWLWPHGRNNGKHRIAWKHWDGKSMQIRSIFHIWWFQTCFKTNYCQRQWGTTFLHHAFDLIFWDRGAYTTRLRSQNCCGILRRIISTRRPNLENIYIYYTYFTYYTTVHYIEILFHNVNKSYIQKGTPKSCNGSNFGSVGWKVTWITVNSVDPCWIKLDWFLFLLVGCWNTEHGDTISRCE